MSASTILVTGGAGLIGSAVLRRLNSLGHNDILVVDKLGTCPHKWKNLRECSFADYIEYDDFRIDKLMPSIRTVIHLGAKSHTTETDAAFLVRNNYHFTMDLARWAAGKFRRFVYASSAATYGADTVMSDTAPIDGLRPLNPYGYSKHLVDLAMTREGLLNSACGMKYFNVFGRNEYHKGDQRSLVAKAYAALKSGKPIELFESPREDIPTESIARDFLSVEDAAKVTVWAAIGAGRGTAGIYNVGSGVASSFTDLARFTAEAYITTHGSVAVSHPDNRAVSWSSSGMATHGLPQGVFRYIPMPQHLCSRYQYFSKAPIEKLRAAGYTEEFTPLKDAVSEYVRWMAGEETL